MSPTDPRHGTLAGYSAHRNNGVPYCDPCRRAMADYKLRENRIRRPNSGLVPLYRFERRIRALQALGWSLNTIADEAGIYHRHLAHTLDGRQTHVTLSTFQRLEAVYERLSMVVPDDQYANRRRIIAKRKRYSPPLAWDDIDDPDETPHVGVREERRKAPVDDVAVARRLNGDQSVRLTHAERAEVLRRWIAADRGSFNEFENHTGIRHYRRYLDDEEAA